MGKSVINFKVYFYNFIIFILYAIYNKVLLKYLYQKFFFSSWNWIKPCIRISLSWPKATQWFTAGNFPISRFIRCWIRHPTLLTELSARDETRICRRNEYLWMQSFFKALYVCTWIHQTSQSEAEKHDEVMYWRRG